MSKVRTAAILLALAFGAAPALPASAAAVAGVARACAAGSAKPALLVRITGFKAHTGTVRVQSYGGDPDHYFDKGTYLKRIDVPVPASGPLEVCVPVPHPGQYAVSVRHDVNGSGHTEKSDGGGMSGNPHVSVMDLIFKRKPSPGEVAVKVGDGPRTVPIVLNYLQGMSFRPIASSD
ncbi:MAG TPA: DUF2141 domain-containing protein [Sphingomonas sp.]|nr:DUF2141 domain-containing protein [Sphingomonas sp.]